MSTPIASDIATPHDVALCRKWAALYRERGLQPLPSSMAEKKPLVRYAHLWEERIEEDLFSRFETANVQVMMGRFWGLLAIDLDGSEAKERWPKLGRSLRTWVTHSGGKGQHHWFRLPEGHPTPLPKAVLWKGEGDHSAIERLCDRSLIMAPPSIHPKTGRRYRFLDKWHSPLTLPLPAMVPGWVLELEPVRTPPTLIAPPVQVPSPRPATAGWPRFRREEVLRAIPDKVGLARAWGVRIEGGPTPNGWQPCHAIGRADVHASAAIHRESGYYTDRGSGERLSLFDLGVRLGIYQDFQHAISDLGATYVGNN